MKKHALFLIFTLLPCAMAAQDLSEGLLVNDLSPHPMEDAAKPDYLGVIVDPSFGTTIRRITNAAPGEVIVPMYSTIQAWNADETLMVLYNQSNGVHELLDGMSYAFIRELDDINALDIEQLFWDFENPDLLYYPESGTYDFIRYTMSTQSKEILVNLADISSCNGSVDMGNDIQMMSWDSDVFTFRCANETAYSYRISSQEHTAFDMADVASTAPGVAPSGNLFYHESSVYNTAGSAVLDLNLSAVEHSCIGKLANGNDAYFAIAFAEGPLGGCLGDVIAHDLTTGACIPLISQDLGYGYPQSGTHISALAHKNTDGGWLAASMLGYDQDGQSLLDQELVIVRADQDDIVVCRIGHHRSDEDQFDYWGEPHAVISPTGTRVLFGSDWSGAEDGLSVDSYVVELPAYSSVMSADQDPPKELPFRTYPNPAQDFLRIEFENPNTGEVRMQVFQDSGQELDSQSTLGNHFEINLTEFAPGIYSFRLIDSQGVGAQGKFIRH